MKESSKKILTLEIAMLIISILNFFFPFLFSFYKYIIFIFIVFGITYFFIGIDLKRSVKEKEILKNMLIMLMIYFLIIYLLGILIGFNKTIYNYKNLLKNVLPDLIFISLCEMIRSQFIKKSSGNKIIKILTPIIFTILEISITFKGYDLSYADGIYEFFGVGILSSLCKNILLTILVFKTDYIDSIIYRGIIELYIYFVPIVPALGPYLTSVFNIILPILISIMTITSSKRKVNDKPKNRKKTNVITTIAVVLLFILVGLNSGIFKYQTIVIGSNSMKDYMERGDVVLIKKLNKSDRNTVDVGDILVFKYDKKIIAHRIYAKEEKNNKYYYTTKGDNNSQVDMSLVEEDNIIGVVKIRFKNLGLPSVWLNDLLK